MTEKKQHMLKWRNHTSLMESILSNDDEQVGLYFDHGLDVNLQFQSEIDDRGFTPLHFCALSGSLSVLSGLIGRGAGVDPSDN
jgi:ankyrin repeat protein